MEVQRELKSVSVWFCLCLLEGEKGRGTALGMNTLLKQLSFSIEEILRK